ncbi:MAG TPA: prepilin peptidase [Armatimonadota bacterium]|jgi:leader peptidase (prepilin peptidase)/N-methyltransferase
MTTWFDILPIWFVLPAAFVFGTVVGSFVNVLIYRIPEDISVVTPPSMCPKCKHRLRAPDLVPLFSFLAAGRKCRYCGEPVSWRYFSIELLTGLVFMLTVWQFGFGANGMLLCLLLASFIGSFIIDLGHFIIPDELNYFGVCVGLLRAAAGGHSAMDNPWGLPAFGLPPSLGASAIGAVGLAGLLFLLSKGGTLLFRKQVAEQQKQWDEQGLLDEGEELEAMGLGDVKLAAAMGANLGLVGGLVGLFVGVTLGAVVGILLKLSKRLRGHAIPFGPYLILGTLAALFWGPAFVTWYLSRMMGAG